MRKVLLHVCCAPDATTAYLRLKKHFDTADFFFYNPNIHPKDEYEKRLEATQKLAEAWDVKLIEGDYEPKRYFEAVKGYENLGEGSIRCFYCIRERLLETARIARKLGYDFFSTSLPTSPKKDFEMIAKAGKETEKAFGVCFFVEDFKKRGGYPLSVKLTKKLDLYRQNYCGCIFSLKEAEKTREESRKRRLQKLQKILSKLQIDLPSELDPEEFFVDEGLINQIGMENLGRILMLIRPRYLAVGEETYKRLWNGKRNARFKKFKVRLKILGQYEEAREQHLPPHSKE